MTSKELKLRIQKFFAHPPQHFKVLLGGGNNRLYDFYIRDRHHVAKEYFSNCKDKRDRLRIEYTALTFLHKNGIKNVPYPIHCNHNQHYAIYTFIEGRKVAARDISRSAVKQMADFLGALNALSRAEEANDLSHASAACLSLDDYKAIIEQRYNRLQKEGKNNPALLAFLNDDFSRVYKSVIESTCLRADKMNIDWSAPLKKSSLTLSPSDYGFHNALLVGNMTVYFLDFEYFGWDDPVKMICDFLWHPALPPANDLKSFFHTTIMDHLKHIPDLRERIFLCSPMIGLIWCLILLNEFIPEGGKRRIFSHATHDLSRSQKKQLVKADKYLQLVTDEHNNKRPHYAS